MEKRLRSNVSRRTWKILRLALLWARKGGVFRRRLAMDLRIVPKFVKSIGHHTSTNDKIQYSYGERELSFDKTPTFHVKMTRPGASMRFLLPRIPCINPEVDFDYDFGEDDSGDRDYGYDDARKSFLVCSVDDEAGYEDCCDETKMVGLTNEEEGGEEGIDVRAEEFIAKFYQQMKLQRQISYLHYKEMLNRGTC